MKKHNCRRMTAALLLAAVLVLLCGTACFAEGLSDDNSLYSLGITTEGATVSPEFYYSTIEYEVTVPAGTASLSLDPVTSNENASILDISGTDLTDGKTTVRITVSAQSGLECTYYLYVTEDTESAADTAQSVTEAQTEAVTEKQTEAETETEPETEDPRYVRVARETLEEANNSITALKEETSGYRDRLDRMTWIMYGLIGVCVVLLFMVINLILKKRDLRAELKNYQSYGYPADGEEEVPAASGKNKKKSKKKSKRKKESAGMDAQPYIPEEPVYEGDPYAGYEPLYDGMGEAGMPYNGSGETFAGGGWPDAGNAQAARETERNDGIYAGEPAPSGKNTRARKADSSVPRPSRENVKARKMPEYEKPVQPYSYEPPKNKESGKDGVEVTMIDL